MALSVLIVHLSISLVKSPPKSQMWPISPIGTSSTYLPFLF
jgi:hypothetical protein